MHFARGHETTTLHMLMPPVGGARPERYNGLVPVCHFHASRTRFGQVFRPRLRWCEAGQAPGTGCLRAAGCSALAGVPRRGIALRARGGTARPHNCNNRTGPSRPRDGPPPDGDDGTTADLTRGMTPWRAPPPPSRPVPAPWSPSGSAQGLPPQTHPRPRLKGPPPAPASWHGFVWAGLPPGVPCPSS